MFYHYICFIVTHMCHFLIFHSYDVDMNIKTGFVHISHNFLRIAFFEVDLVSQRSDLF